MRQCADYNWWLLHLVYARDVLLTSLPPSYKLKNWSVHLAVKKLSCTQTGYICLKAYWHKTPSMFALRDRPRLLKAEGTMTQHLLKQFHVGKQQSTLVTLSVHSEQPWGSGKARVLFMPENTTLQCTANHQTSFEQNTYQSKIGSWCIPVCVESCSNVKIQIKRLDPKTGIHIQFGDGFFLTCDDFGRMVNHSFPAWAFFCLFEVEISSCTLIPFFYARISPQWLSKLKQL